MQEKLKRALRQFADIRHTAHKPYLFVFFELIFWVIANRGEINVYFDYELFLKGKKKSDYLKTKDFNKINRELNSPEYFPILEDKYFFYQTLKGQNFSSPKNLFLIDPSGIYDIEADSYITQRDFLANNLDGFCKLINGYGGMMIYQVEVVKGILLVNKEEISIGDFMQKLGKRHFLIQERIEQHQAMNALNPSCINTIRMLTLRTGPTYQYFQGYLRIGINNHFVDNSVMGNLMIGIDKDRGSLMDHAYSFTGEFSKEELERHPQTKTVFKNYEIPFYKESVEMVESLHRLFRQFFMIGWDIGITPEGPIVLEGNNITSPYSYQVIYGGVKNAFEGLAEEYRKYQV